MNKIKSFAILFTIMITLTACGNAPSKEAKAPDKPDNTISTATVETKVEEYKEDEYKFGPAELVCYMPEDFEETDYPGEYLHKSYPDDVSSINHIIGNESEDILDMTSEEFAMQIASEYYDGYGENVDINVTQYDKIIVDGRPGFWIMYNFDFRREHYETLEVILYNADETHSVTFLQGPGSDCMEEFIETAKTIGFSDSIE